MPADPCSPHGQLNEITPLSLSPLLTMPFARGGGGECVCVRATRPHLVLKPLQFLLSVALAYLPPLMQARPLRLSIAV